MTDQKTAGAMSQGVGVALAQLRDTDPQRFAEFMVESAGRGYPLSARLTARFAGVSASTALRAIHAAHPPDEDGMIVVPMCRGLDDKLRPGRRFDTSDRDTEIRRLRSEGQSMRAIASEVECSVGTVHRVLSR